MKKKKSKLNEAELRRNYKTVAKSKSELEILKALNDNMNWYMETKVKFQKLGAEHKEIYDKIENLKKLADKELKPKIKKLEKDKKQLIEKSNSMRKETRKREIELEVYNEQLGKKLGVDIRLNNIFSLPYAMFKYFEGKTSKKKR
jgi:hypothetical protein